MSSRNGAYRRNRKIFIAMKLAECNLTCEYCGQTDLIIKHNNDPEIPKHRRLTIDHITAIVDGGKGGYIGNFRLSCLACNNEKDNEEKLIRSRNV